MRELLFVPLGGTGEIGMNLNLYCYDGVWVMVDCGMMINTVDGEDRIFAPDPAFLLDKDITALVLTHAHEDHIGAITDLWMTFRCPIYATPFTAAVVRRKVAESDLPERVPLKIVPPGARFDIGPFSFEMIPITHSTVESQSLVLRTAAGAVLHTGDWKLDPKPLVGPATAEARFKALAKERVLAVVGDSTNAQIPGRSGSESLVRERLKDLIGRERNRVVCACFSSNIARVATFLEVAAATGRHPVLVGRSLLRMVGAAQETGYLPRALNEVPLRDAMYLPRHKVLMICTGSQGETRAALSRISFGQHRDVFLEPDDVIFFSSKVIPGNEEGIERLQRRFQHSGVRVVSERDDLIHVSGHPCIDELKQLYGWVRPECLIPVHGYPEHLIAHAQVGRDLGLRHVLEVRNGDVVHLNAETPRVVGEAPVGRVMRPPEAPYAGQRGRDERGGRADAGRGAPAARPAAGGRGAPAAPARGRAPSGDAFARRARLIEERGGAGEWGRGAGRGAGGGRAGGGRGGRGGR